MPKSPAASTKTPSSQDPELRVRCDILCSIPGIAALTAAALLVEMPELGSLQAKQAASLAGLAPATRQSGKWTGRARIRGGRPDLRQALYRPALITCPPSSQHAAIPK